MDNTPKYLKPKMVGETSFEELIKGYRDYDYYFRIGFGDKTTLEIEDLLTYDFTFIVGEPGQGKTRLLEELSNLATEQNKKVVNLNLRERLSNESLEVSIAHKDPSSKDNIGDELIVCFDGLDEVATPQLPETIELIRRYKKDHKNHKVFVTSRLHFFSKYESRFTSLTANYILLLPLDRSQAQEFLKELELSEQDLETIFSQLRPNRDRGSIIENPRYLIYLADWLKENPDIKNINRSSIFNHFIDKALINEDISSEKRLAELKRRTLEKLALVMKTAQTNTITHEELITFIDVFKSEAKSILMNQMNIEDLYNHSLIKDDGVNISFDNAELQEYLAACALHRMNNLSRSVFNLAVDEQRTILPSWINTLSFVLEMHPELLAQILNLQDADPDNPGRPQDPDTHKLVSGVSSHLVPEEVRTDIFKRVLGYYLENNVYISFEVVRGLAFYATEDARQFLKKKAEEFLESNNYFGLVSIALLVGQIQRIGYLSNTEIRYWVDNLVKYANITGVEVYAHVLQRYALHGLEAFDDTSVIEKTKTSHTSNDELVRRAFESMCDAIDPNFPASIETFITGVKREKSIEARQGLRNISTKESIGTVLEALASDNVFLQEMIDHEPLFPKENDGLITNIDTYWQDEWLPLCKQVIQRSSEIEYGYFSERSSFITRIIQLIAKHDLNYFHELIDWTDDEDNIHRSSELLQNLARIIKPEDVPYLVEKIKKSNRLKWIFFRILTMASSVSNEDAEIIETEGRRLLPVEFTEHDRNLAEALKDNSNDPALEEFHENLKLAELRGGDSLLALSKILTILTTQNNTVVNNITVDEKTTVWTLCKELVLDKLDPGAASLTINQTGTNGAQNYTISSFIPIFYDVAEYASKTRQDISDYRTKFISLIPLAYNDTLEACLSLLGTLTTAEVDQLLNIYTDETSDVPGFMPSNIIETAKRFSLIEAVPVIDRIIDKGDLNNYLRSSALEVSENIKPSKSHLESTFIKYKDQAEQVELARKANALLITKHSDVQAVKWLIEDIKISASEFTEPEGIHSVGPMEHELHGSEKAQPLKDISNPSFIDDYLLLLDFSFELFNRGQSWHDYAFYIWKIVTAYFTQLTTGMKYVPLETLERWVGKHSEVGGVNLFKDQVVSLRKKYAEAINKPRNFNEALKKVGQIQENDSQVIGSNEELGDIVTKVILERLVPWIEGEARKILNETQAQKLIRVQLENALMKEGFRPDELKACNILREAQSLDDKRPDFLIYHGFLVPVVIETKLLKHGDLSEPMETKESYASLKRYMSDYSAVRAILFVIDNKSVPKATFDRKLKRINKAYSKINGVTVISVQIPEA